MTLDDVPFRRRLRRRWDVRPEATALDPDASIPDIDEAQGRYRVHFAWDEAQRDAAFRLRFEVFNLELGEGLPESYEHGKDRDQFDDRCQHLLVSDLETGVLVGTYRLQLPEVARAGGGFYSATEFDLSTVPADVLDVSIEAGRACIAREHRNRAVLALLWRGLLAFVIWNKKRYFFGCSSLTSQDPAEGLSVWRWLVEQGLTHPEIEVRPLPEVVCEAPASALVDGEALVPKLFRTYLRHGARVLGPPAIDRVFGTIDFLTLIDVARVDPRTIRTIGG